MNTIFEDMFDHCNPDSSTANEDQADYSPKWSPLGDIVTQAPEYQYMKASDLNGFAITAMINSYGGGGYIIPLNNHSTTGKARYLRTSMQYIVDIQFQYTYI